MGTIGKYGLRAWECETFLGPSSGRNIHICSWRMKYSKHHGYYSINKTNGRRYKTDTDVTQHRFEIANRVHLRL